MLNLTKFVRKAKYKIQLLKIHFCFLFKPQTPLNELNCLKIKLQALHKCNYPHVFVNIGDYTYGHPKLNHIDGKTKLSIGKFCSIAEGVIIVMGGEHHSDWVTTYPFNVLLKNYRNIKGHPYTKGDITIGNDVWIGGNTKIISGVKIGDGCVVGANSLVTKDIPDYSICGGVPAKIIRKRFSEKTIEKLREIKWWDWQEKDLCEIIPLLQSSNIDGLIEYYDMKQNKSEPSSTSVYST
jgi:acetyltransferase-like isoleucine patch superfamily enzyme